MAVDPTRESRQQGPTYWRDLLRDAKETRTIDLEPFDVVIALARAEKAIADLTQRVQALEGRP